MHIGFHILFIHVYHLFCRGSRSLARSYYHDMIEKMGCIGAQSRDPYQGHRPVPLFITPPSVDISAGDDCGCRHIPVFKQYARH
jgi:hypothetical protein